MTKYVVYHISSTMLESTHDTAGAAKRSCTCKNKKEKARYDREVARGWESATEYKEKYASTDDENYRKNVVYMETKKNLLSGVEYQEASNTPGYCSPSSEAYWCK